METPITEEVLVFEFDFYLNYNRLYNLKIFRKGDNVWFDITYEGFFCNVSDSLQEKVNNLFDAVKTKGDLRSLPLAIYRLIVPAKYAPEKIFIFKVYDRISEKTKIAIK